jgi:NADH:ubiquinone oxidoreductase subunit 3 (subunit A)
VLGTGALVGGALAGDLYDHAIPVLIITTVIIQVAAGIVLIASRVNLNRRVNKETAARSEDPGKPKAN